MAEIKGITLKGLTSFVGMENLAYQGNIYLNGKKIGWFSQSGDGGCSTIRYNNREIKNEVDKIIKKYFEENPPDIEWANTDEFFYEILLNLILEEKDFKKTRKKGYAWQIIADTKFDPDTPYKEARVYSIPPHLASNEKIKELISELEAEGYNKIKIYKSLNDFCI